MTTAAGLYLYGITRSPADIGAVVLADDAPLQLIECDGLAAVACEVSLADFSQTAMQQRLRNASELEDVVRKHNGVVEAIHAQQPILPARFGMVYASADDIASALRPATDVLRHQLDRLAGCDEWAFHLYANCPVVRDRIATNDPSVRALRDKRSSAPPGRAYFLEQQLRNELDAATHEKLVTIGENAFDLLSSFAVAAQANPLSRTERAANDVEILRASFLVLREAVELFEKAMTICASPEDGLRFESSGPWPPYSFAAWNDDEGDAT